MQTLTNTSNQSLFNYRHVNFFLISFLFLPLPLITSNSFLQEELGALIGKLPILNGSNIAGSALLVTGVTFWSFALVVIPLVCFTWGQVAFWSKKDIRPIDVKAYLALAFAYALLTGSIIWTGLSRF